MINIPGTSKRFPQTNQSDLLGTLYMTKGCDFDTNKGGIQLGKRLLLNTATADQANMVLYPVAFKVFDNGTGAKIYSIAGQTEGSGVGNVYQGGISPDVAFTAITGGGSIATVDSQISDMELMNGELWVTGDSSAAYYLDSTNTWANTSTGSTANGYARPLKYFGLVNRLYTVIDGYKVVSVAAGSHTFATIGAANTMSIQSFPNTTSINEVITFIKASSNRLWIGTTSLTGQRGSIYEWDGVSTQYQKRYVMEATGALSCVIKDDVPWVIDSNGKLLVWTSQTFTEKASFFKRNMKQFYNMSFKTNKRFIHPNGMEIIDGDIHILIDLTNNDAANHGGTQEDCNPSGIYVFDMATNSLRHKYSFGLTKSNQSVKDFGAFRIWRAGALTEIPSTKDYPANTGNGMFLAGCSYYTDATTTTSGIFYDDSNDTLKKAGNFVTTIIESDKNNVKDSWHKLYVFHGKYLNATDRMVAKYRVIEDTPIESDITWLDTQTFVASGVGAYIVGDEVEILLGTGSGICSHITSITQSNSGYIVQVNEVHTGATGTSRARFAKWNLLGNVQDVEDFNELPISQTSSWIQFKIWMNWTNKNEFTGMTISNSLGQKME